MNKAYMKRLMSRSAALFRVKKFKLGVSQQVLEVKRTWQEAGGRGGSFRLPIICV